MALCYSLAFEHGGQFSGTKVSSINSLCWHQRQLAFVSIDVRPPYPIVLPSQPSRLHLPAYGTQLPRSTRLSGPSLLVHLKELNGYVRAAVRAVDPCLAGVVATAGVLGGGASATFSFHGCRHMGHLPLESERIHSLMQCQWKQCVHSPMPEVYVSA